MMKHFFLIVLMFFLLSAGSADAFFSSGNVDNLPGFRYTNLRVTGTNASVTVHNDTDQSVTFYGKLLFADIMGDVVGITGVVSTFIPAGKKAELVLELSRQQFNPKKVQSASTVRWIEVAAYKN